MLIAIVPLLVLIIGLLMWCLCKGPRLVQIGWLMVQVGALVATFVYATYRIRLG